MAVAPPPVRTRPLGVTILAVLTILVGIGTLLLGVALFALGAFAGAFSLGFLAALGVLAGLVFVVVGILFLAAGFGLLNLRKWAWWLAILAFIVSLASSALSANYVFVAIDALLVIYLILVRKHFA